MRRGHPHRWGKNVYSLMPDPQRWNRRLDDTAGIGESPWHLGSSQDPSLNIICQEWRLTSLEALGHHLFFNCDCRSILWSGQAL